MGYEHVLSWLTDHRNADGSWGYLPGQPGVGEATLIAAAAGAPAPLEWLEATDLEWASLLLPAALSRVDGAAGLRAAAVERVLAARGEVVAETPGTYDGTLVGWSWVPGTFTWVEPTAWGLLSLRAADLGEHARAREAEAVLADRQCSDGGWNAGTPDVLGEDLPGYLYLTGWVVMALLPGAMADRGLAFLDRLGERPSTRNLSLGILARLAHGRAPGEAVEALLARQAEDGSFGERNDGNALAACALRAVETGVFPFREGLDVDVGGSDG